MIQTPITPSARNRQSRPRIRRRSFVLRLTDGSVVLLTVCWLPWSTWQTKLRTATAAGWHGWRIGARVIAFRLQN
jgi:hypothetical protein